MAYDQDLAGRIRSLLPEDPGITEREMFGGIGFMVHGNMLGGVIDGDMIVRVGPEGYEQTLTKEGVGPFDMTGRPMRGWVQVEGAALEEKGDLEEWVQRGLQFASNLPQKS